MDEEITISIGPNERILLDEVLKSSLLEISTTEEALLWSLGVAKLLLVELEKLISPDQSTKVSRPLGTVVSEPSPAILVGPYDPPGIPPEPAPAPMLGPYDPPGIPPEIAPEPMVEPVSPASIARTIHIHLEESEVEPLSTASDFDLPNLDSG